MHFTRRGHLEYGVRAEYGVSECGATREGRRYVYTHECGDDLYERSGVQLWLVARRTS